MLLFAHIDNTNNGGKEDDFLKVRKIRSGDKAAFEKLFFEYHDKLIRFANTITKSKELARDTVQDVFLKIWRNREDWELHYSIKVYLYQAVRNQALNLLEKKKALLRLKKNYQSEVESHNRELKQDETLYGNLTELEIRQLKRIWELVEEMPERRRISFELNRRHGFSYEEISKVLGISKKTVENHIGQAIKYIREKISSEDFK